MSDSDLFVRTGVSPTAYRDLLSGRFGQGWLGWEPETLKAEIGREWTDPIEQVFEKIMALQTFLTTDLFWDEILPFENIVLAFNDSPVDFDLIQRAQPKEIAYGVSVARDLKDREDFVEDIIEYIRASHREDGVLVYHPILWFSMPPRDDDKQIEIERAVIASIDDERPPNSADTNAENPIDVQKLKTWGCMWYVLEKTAKGQV